nr:hypothetical protein L204_04129 [Cryptococcus depauperatus CBS 7855]
MLTEKDLKEITAGFENLEILQAADSHTKESGQSLCKTLETQLLSDDLNARKSACEVMLELLNQGDEEMLEQRRLLVLQDSPLTFIPLILPLISVITDTASHLLVLIATHGRSREVIMALSEALQHIIDRAEGFVVSDDEGEDLQEKIEPSLESLWAEWRAVLTCLSKAISRLPNARSTPTLLSLCEVLSSSLISLGPEAHQYPTWTCLSALNQFVLKAWEWVQGTSDKGGEQSSLLSNLLFEGVTLLGSGLKASITEWWFLATFPKYAAGPSLVETLDNSDPNGEAKAGQQELNVSRKLLPSFSFIDRIIYSSNLSTYSTFASFNILAVTIGEGKLNENLPDPVPRSIIGDMMPVLCAALSGTSVDAGVAWLWWLVNDATKRKRDGNQNIDVSYDNVAMLVELLIPLTVQHSSRIMRLATLKLIGATISALDGLDKVMAFKQVLEQENPFDTVRIECLTVLREVTASSSDILSLQILDHLHPVLFTRSNSESQDNGFNLSPLKLLTSPYIDWWTGVAQYVWFLSTFDKSDATGIRSKYRNEIVEWIEDVYRKLEQVKRARDTSQVDPIQNLSEGRLDFVLARLEDTLDRAKSALTA